MNELRQRLHYVGRRRIDDTGKPIGLRHFALPSGAIRWSCELQALAIEHGFFFERVTTDNHVRVLPRGPYLSDVEVMAALEALAFHHDPFAVIALAFVEQQDRYGYTGAWDRICQTYAKPLKWYKAMKARERSRTLTNGPQFRDLSTLRWNGHGRKQG